MNTENEKHIVIVGAGFAGIRCALDLSKKRLKNTKITLIANKPYFEYYPRLYRVVTGSSPIEACVRLDDIFKDKKVEIVVDEVANVDIKTQSVAGKSGSVYHYTDLVLALGSETVYFGIDGVQERAFGFKSINEALTLKNHLHKMFDVYLSENKEDIISKLSIVIVGGGPSGVELAGELTKYMKMLSVEHTLDNAFVTIDLVEAAPRLLPTLPEEVSVRVYNKLHSLGVNIFLNRTVVKEDIDKITMKDMDLKTNTMIWTAGSRTNHFYSTVVGLQIHKSGRVIVDEHMQAVDAPHVYIAGDAALTQYSGLAQTAIYDGAYIADTLYKISNNKKPRIYKPKKVSYAVPVSSKWAAVSVGPFKFYGYLPHILRELIDLRFFFSILSIKQAFQVFCSEYHRCESCPTCMELLTPKAE